MKQSSRWKNDYATKTVFDEIEGSLDKIRSVFELRSKFLKRAELKPMAKIRGDEDSHDTSRALHMRQTAEIALQIARGLGLNEIIAYIGMLGHDAGHSFFGHEGEHTMSIIGKLYNVGYFHHNAKGIDVILSEDMIDKIIEAFPETKDDKMLANKMKEDIWYFLDVVISHDGEAATNKIVSDKEKYNTIKESVLARVTNANVKDEYRCNPGTLEAVISRPADVISYIKTDLMDAFSENIITKLDDEHFETIGAILCESTEERNANEIAQDKEKIKKERIEKVKKLLFEYRKKHLREFEEDIDVEKMKLAESIISRVEQEGINIYNVYTKDDMKEDIKALKAELKERKTSFLEYTKIVKKEKEKFVKKYEKSEIAERRINQVLEEVITEHREKREKEGVDANTIASEVNKIEEYAQKLTKERKRVVEDLMNDVQNVIINDFVENTKRNWEGLEDYEEMKAKMGFSKGMEENLTKKLKTINYKKYVSFTKKEYQEKSIPEATFKLVNQCAISLIKTGVIRNKFYDPMVLSKIQNQEVKDCMKVPERDEEQYEEYKRSINISKGIKLIRPKNNKHKKLTGKNKKRKMARNALYKDIYSYTERQDTRFAMNCENVYYAIEHTIKKNVENAYNEEYEPEAYLKKEQDQELARIKAEIDIINETEQNLETAKEKFIQQEMANAREKFEEKVAIEIAIRYIAGTTDKKIVKTLLKTGNLSRARYNKENKTNKNASPHIKRLIKEHSSRKEEELEK